MQEPVAEVIALSGGVATVTVDAGVGCARCAAGKGCGAGLLAGPARPRRFDVPVPDGLDLRRGDRVSLSLSPRHLLQASLTAYGLPLIALLAVPAAANGLWGPLPDLQLAMLAVLAVAASVVAGRRRLQRDACLNQFLPSIAGRVARGPSA